MKVEEYGQRSRSCNQILYILVDLTLRRTTMCSNELPLAKNNKLLFLMSNSRISNIFDKKRHTSTTCSLLHRTFVNTIIAKTSRNCVTIANGSIHLVLPKPGQLASSRNYTETEIHTLKTVSESMTKHVGNGFINFGSANAEILAIFTVLWVDLRVSYSCSFALATGHIG
ncbi:hypothetical protein HZH68_015453 [Vespula germanica]|uniref:Uncharacterized protein n=1 Tax=Vespula germanica TaxID=30212 RepID=A0A834MSZ2_VESGE|nr:hypothetical protein HZH68_015453 [Vespula germanica]